MELLGKFYNYNNSLVCAAVQKCKPTLPIWMGSRGEVSQIKCVYKYVYTCLYCIHFRCVVHAVSVDHV